MLVKLSGPNALHVCQRWGIFASCTGCRFLDEKARYCCYHAPILWRPVFLLVVPAVLLLSMCLLAADAHESCACSVTLQPNIVKWSDSPLVDVALHFIHTSRNTTAAELNRSTNTSMQLLLRTQHCLVLPFLPLLWLECLFWTALVSLGPVAAAQQAIIVPIRLSNYKIC